MDFDTFSDLDREMVGETDWRPTNLEDKISQAKDQIRAWMTSYRKNRWENQSKYVEVLIEKKALQGVFERVCWRNDVGLGACKGYPSLTFLHDAYQRYSEVDAVGKEVVILYFGDYDPSGEDIPRSIVENLFRMGVTISLKRILLMEHQVKEWNLPHAPVKEGDSRSANWDGIGQVELDAIRPEVLQRMCQEAINQEIDPDDLTTLREIEAEERIEFREALKRFVDDGLPED